MCEYVSFGDSPITSIDLWSPAETAGTSDPSHARRAAKWPRRRPPAPPGVPARPSVRPPISSSSRNIFGAEELARCRLAPSGLNSQEVSSGARTAWPAIIANNRTVVVHCQSKKVDSSVAQPWRSAYRCGPFLHMWHVAWYLCACFRHT